MYLAKLALNRTLPDWVLWIAILIVIIGAIAFLIKPTFFDTAKNEKNKLTRSDIGTALKAFLSEQKKNLFGGKKSD